MKYLKILSGAAAILALLQTQVAAAKAVDLSCVRESDLADAVVYAVPSLIGAFQAKCGPSLPASGFMKTQGSRLASEYAARQSAAWSGAQRLLLQITAAGATDSRNTMAEIIAGLPADTLRPFVDAMIQQEVSKKIPATECGNIERGISYLAPLPPESMGGLVSFIVRMAAIKKPAICENPVP